MKQAFARTMASLAERWEDLCQWAAWLMPRRLVYWCGVRMMAHASIVNDHEEMNDISPVQVLDAWDRYPEERA